MSLAALGQNQNTLKFNSWPLLQASVFPIEGAKPAYSKSTRNIAPPEMVNIFDIHRSDIDGWDRKKTRDTSGKVPMNILIILM